MDPHILYNWEDALLFAFVHGGTKAEENKDAKLLKKNFEELLQMVKEANIKNHDKEIHTTELS